MANEKTTNIGLELTTEDSTKFKYWHKLINGKGPITDEKGNVLATQSNAEIIDAVIGGIQDNFDNYYTTDEVYTKTETNSAIAEAVKDFTKFDIKIVSDISKVTETGHIYLILKDPTNPAGGYYEYIYVEQDHKAELIGSTDINVDSVLSTTSNNPIANNAVATAVNSITISIADITNSIASLEQELGHTKEDVSGLIGLSGIKRVFSTDDFNTKYGYDADFDEYWFDITEFLKTENEGTSPEAYGLLMSLLLGGQLTAGLAPVYLEDGTVTTQVVSVKSTGLGTYNIEVPDPDTGSTKSVTLSYIGLEGKVYQVDNKVVSYRGTYELGESFLAENETIDDLKIKIENGQYTLDDFTAEQETETVVLRVTKMDDRPELKTINGNSLYGEGNITITDPIFYTGGNGITITTTDTPTIAVTDELAISTISLSSGIKVSDGSSSYLLYPPHKDGTIATTDDIPTIYPIIGDNNIKVTRKTEGYTRDELSLGETITITGGLNAGGYIHASGVISTDGNIVTSNATVAAKYLDIFGRNSNHAITIGSDYSSANLDYIHGDLVNGTTITGSHLSINGNGSTTSFCNINSGNVSISSESVNISGSTASVFNVNSATTNLKNVAISGSIIDRAGTIPYTLELPHKSGQLATKDDISSSNYYYEPGIADNILVGLSFIDGNDWKYAKIPGIPDSQVWFEVTEFSDILSAYYEVDTFDSEEEAQSCGEVCTNNLFWYESGFMVYYGLYDEETGDFIMELDAAARVTSGLWDDSVTGIYIAKFVNLDKSVISYKGTVDYRITYNELNDNYTLDLVYTAEKMADADDVQEKLDNETTRAIIAENVLLDKVETYVVANPTVSATTSLSRLQIGSTIYSISGGGGGGTSDYIDLANKPSINGTTLVGNITLPTMSTLENYQPKLTAGANITIENNVISATGGGGTGEFANGVNYLTTAPTADNPNAGTLKFVVLSEEPETKYNGYFYIITE